jgi:hypothetical protein
MMMRAGPESAKRAERWDDDDDDEDREEEDYNDDDDDEEIERDERPLPGVGNPVSFVGMNFCGADPSLPCVMKVSQGFFSFPSSSSSCVFFLKVWRTADEAFEHVLAEHMRFYESKYWCQWWGCDFSVARKSKMESHYQKHMVGEWRCGICSEMFPDKRLAVGCVHLNRLVELVAQYSFCEYEGCSKPGVQMSSLKLRDHISEHVDLEPTQVSLLVFFFSSVFFFTSEKRQRFAVSGKGAKRRSSFRPMFVICNLCICDCNGDV